MADRSFYQLAGSLERNVVLLAGSYAIGATGAVGAKTGGAGFASLVRNSAGNYTLTLEDAFPALLIPKAVVKTAAGTDLTVAPVSWDVKSAKTIVFQVKAGAVATDPSDGDELFIELTLSNASKTPVA